VRYVCPNCDVRSETNNGGTMMHVCAGLSGLSAPMVPEGSDAKVEAFRREDYLGGDLAQHDGDGKAFSHLVTTHGDGHTDVVVLAPTIRVQVT